MVVSAVTPERGDMVQGKWIMYLFPLPTLKRQSPVHVRLELQRCLHKALVGIWNPFLIEIMVHAVVDFLGLPATHS